MRGLLLCTRKKGGVGGKEQEKNALRERPHPYQLLASENKRPKKFSASRKQAFNVIERGHCLFQPTGEVGSVIHVVVL